MDGNGLNKPGFRERRDEVYMFNSVWGECWQEELKENDKHEIIIKICEQIGKSPCNIALAEEIFEKVKFDVAKYVLHHEYCRCNHPIRSSLLIWLDSKINPAKAEKLTDFIDKYLK